MKTFNEWLKNRILSEGNQKNARELRALLEKEGFIFVRDGDELIMKKDDIPITVSKQSDRVLPRKLVKTVLRDWQRNKDKIDALRARRAV